MRMKQTEEKITALYERLSRDDDNAGDSNSIPDRPMQHAGHIATKYQQQFKCVSVGTDCVAAQVSLCRQILCKILRQK